MFPLELDLRSRVVACAGGGATRLESRTLRPPGPGELLLETRVSGLCGTDLFKLSNDTASPGAVLGHELVGTVVASGADVGAFPPGSRVVVPHHVACGRCPLCLRGSPTLCDVFRENLLEPGGFSDLVLVRERAVKLAARIVPEGVSDEAAVFLEPAACVLRGLDRSGLLAPGAPPGTALVLGGGSMGLLHLLVLRAARPDVQCIVADTVPERLALARKLGARAAEAPGGELGRAVAEASGGLGADAVFDTVGGARVLATALELSREGGSIVLFAHAAAGERAGFELNELFKHERRILGTYSGALEEQDRIYQLLLSGRLDASPLVTHRLGMSRFDEGVDLSRARKALKVLYVGRREAP